MEAETIKSMVITAALILLVVDGVISFLGEHYKDDKVRFTLVCLWLLSAFTVFSGLIVLAWI